MKQHPVEPGTVIRVRDWPHVAGDRFLVREVFDKPGSEWPQQVNAFRIEKDGKGWALAAQRTFPLELCEVDTKATKARAEMGRRIRARLAGTHREEEQDDGTGTDAGRAPVEQKSRRRRVRRKRVR